MKKSMLILGAIFFASCMMISCDNASQANHQTNKSRSAEPIKADSIAVKNNDQINTKIDKLTKEELEVLRIVKVYHKDLEFTQEVTRNFILIKGKPELLNTSFNFKKDKDGSYFGSFINYDVKLSPDLTTITYSYSAGTAASGEGKIFMLGGSVIRNEFSYGTGAGFTTIWVNEKKVFEELEEF